MGRAALLALMVAVLAPPAHAQASACSALARPLPEPQACAATAGWAETAERGHGGLIAQLLDEAETNTSGGRFETAEHALDCAEAALEVLESRQLSGATAGRGELRYQLARKRGILDYRRERLPQALSWFECALKRSTAMDDSEAIARDLKNVGSVLRRLGDFNGALRALTESLDRQRTVGAVGGAVLNNIADVYRELDDPEQAMHYYQEALSAFRKGQQATEASHVLEAMSELSLDSGDTESAQRWLEQALQSYRDSGNPAYQLRAHGGLIRTALEAGHLPQALNWSASALAIADAQNLQVPADVHEQIARSERLSGRPEAAESRLRTVLARLAAGDTARPPLLEELAATLEARGEHAAALVETRLAQQEERRLARAQTDRQLGWLRTRFELSERDHTIAALESENQLNESRLKQRTLLLGLSLALTLAGLLSLWLVLQRRSQRERLRVAAERVREQEELARYRRETDALAEDRSLLQTLLDSRESALCLLDAEGQLLAANLAARRLLGLQQAASASATVADLFTVADAARLLAALEQMEDASVQNLELEAVQHAQPLQAQLSPWARGDGLIVMELSEGGEPATEAQPAPASTEKPEGELLLREDFKRSVVELMLAVVDAWERATGSNRLELAEKSRIWRVSIDDGRLRARAMERYLAVSKLPRNPRWRDVLRSAYYVLGQCSLEPPIREDLKRRADAVLAYTRREALV